MLAARAMSGTRLDMSFEGEVILFHVGFVRSRLAIDITPLSSISRRHLSCSGGYDI